MTEKFGLKTFCGDADSEVCGVYCCDLLSRVLVSAEEGSVWLTVMNNANVAAVAYAKGLSAVVLTEGVLPDGELLKAARTHGVCLLGTSLSTYELSCKLYGAFGV